MLVLLLYMMVGGFEEADLKQMPKGVMKAFKKATYEFKNLKIVKVERQVVAGLNFKFTVAIGEKQAEFTFWQKLDQKVQFTGMKWLEQ